jgi:negative regulator of replication initiation
VKFHKVEVDSEVFQYVQAHAEPLVDTFNSALRRLLLVSDQESDKPKNQDVSPPQSNGLLPNLSGQTPQALRHTLEVAYLVRGGSYDRPSATQFVAKLYNVLPKTVLDKYCRQLNLKAREFDRLLEQPDLKDLKGILTSKFPDYGQVIEETLS